MTTKSYTSRTTLWDAPVPGSDSAPDDYAPTPARGAWRAPSAVLAGDRAARRGVVGVPSLPETEEDHGPIPRRTNFNLTRTPWWRPRTSFGRIVLGTGTFFGLAAAITLYIAARHFALRDIHFMIPGASSIRSTGLSEINRAEILPVFGEDIGRNVFFVPLTERRKQLEALPWVKEATVMRFLPDEISISIVERTPVAFVRQGSQVELADADGVILSMPPAMMSQRHYSFPVITGIDAKDTLASRRSRMAVYQRFIDELDQNKQHLADQVSEIDLSDPEDLRATMPEQGSDILAHFGQDQFLHRLQIYQAHIAEWRQRYPKLKGVDLRYNGEVPLEMESEAAAPPAARITAIGISNAKPQAASKPAPVKPAPAAIRKPAAIAAAKPKPKATPLTAQQHREQEARKFEARKSASAVAAAKAAKAKAAHKPAPHTTPKPGQ